MIRLLLCLIVWWIGTAQNIAQTYTYENTDQLTKQIFIAQDWDKLLSESQKVLKKGIDFYDLRVRRGLAYLEKQKYRLSITEFEAARKFFPADTASIYYNALAYLRLGNQTLAKQQSFHLPDSLKKALEIKKSPFTEMGIFGSYSFFDASKRATTLLQKETGEWNGYRGLTGGGFYLRYVVSNRLSFTQGASSFLFQNFKKANYPNQKVIFYNDGVQIGVHTIAHLSLPKRLGVHFSMQYNHIASYVQNFNNTKKLYEVTDFSKGGISLGGYIEKGIKNVDLLLGTYWNNFLGYYTLQETVGFTYYPFGNTRLSLRGQFSSLQNLTEENPAYQKSFLFFVKANIQLHKKIWLSASYLEGDTQNFFDIENNAIYYTADRTKNITQANLHILAGKHLRLNVGYMFLKRDSSTFNILNLNLPITPIYYFAHQVNAGVSWVF